MAQALRKCPDLVLAPPDFRLYGKDSKAFMDICRSYAPAVEKFSIDECFLDMTGTGHMYPDPVAAVIRSGKSVGRKHKAQIDLKKDDGQP